MQPTYKRIHVIVNPASGQDQPFFHAVNHVFHPAGIDWDIYITKKGGDARRLAKEAVKAGADAVAVYGGDGTVAEVAAGLTGSNTPLAILPGGTTNATARVLGVPTDLAKAVSLITDPNAAPKSFDMMRVGDGFVFGVVALGVMGDVAVNTDRASKDRLGNVAYGISAVKASWYAHHHKSDYIIRLDGRELRGNGVACLITNHGAGFFNLKPPIDASDGLLDVMVFSGKRMRTVSGAAANLVTRNERFTPVEHWQGKVVEVVSEPAQNIQADGEALEAGKVNVEVASNAVRFIVPNGKP